jgi:uncharacterized protein YjdB
MMPASLAAQFPDIKTFTAEAVNDKRITAKLDFTLFGFHTAVFGGKEIAFVDPYDNLNDGYYVVHYKSDEGRTATQRMRCEVKENDEYGPAGETMDMMTAPLPSTNLHKIKIADPATGLSILTTDGAVSTEIGGAPELLASGTPTPIRNYELALSANNFYCRAATGLTTPTIGQCFSAMTTSMNRVNGVYNRELSVQMNFCVNENLLIWPTATGSSNGADPFDAINSNASSCIATNQTTCDTRIGSGNYDIGHVFTTGAGGLASVGVVCNNSNKGRGVTGSSTPVGDSYDIDYVCHEMGHQFGSSHTFNNNTDGSCSGNASMTHAYEPASGSTIMDYAGICSPDNVQRNSDAYFSANSLEQILPLLSGSEAVCATNTPTSHGVASIGTYTLTRTIPYKTPFELSGPTATGSVGDTALTYGWYQNNLGDFGLRLNQTHVRGPIFRSYQPAYANERVFPCLDSIIKGVYNHPGERMADTARFLTFKTVIRNIASGMGGALIPTDTVHLDVVSTGLSNGFQGFTVTSQGTAGIVYTGSSTQTITWNVVGTNAAPVNATNVDIFMSVDGGHTWPYTVGTFPNSGTASITVPNPAVSTTTARFKVKGNNNVFFNINSRNFTVNPGAITAPITGTFTVCVTGSTTLSDATPGGTWSSSSPAVATVGVATGIVTGISGGTATITYTAPSGPVTAVVSVNTIPAPGAIAGSSIVCIGNPVTLTNGTPGGVWSSSDITRATVSASGVVTGIAAGTANITYSVTNGCGTGTATKTMTISAPTAVAPITGTLSICQSTTSLLADATPSGVWSSSATGIATISGAGLVAGASAGTTTISYTVTNGSGCVSAASAIFTVNALPVATTTPSGSVVICLGGSVVIAASPTTAGLSYQWQDGGIDIAGATNSTFTALTPGDFSVQITNVAGCMGASAAVNVTSSGAGVVVPSIGVSANPGINICSAVGTVTFTATPVNGGATPAYQWSVNGVTVGSSVATYAYIPTNGDIVACQLTSSLPCAVPTTATDNVTMAVTTSVTPAVSVDAFPNDTICTGQSATYTAIPVGGGTAPAYQWIVNGINVATGPTYSTTPANGDLIVCQMTSNAACRTSTIVNSTPVIVTVQAPATNTIAISASASSIVAGESVTFVAIAPNAGPGATYQWYIDGVAVPGAVLATFATTSLTNGQVVHCKVTSMSPCVLPHTVMSGGFTMMVTSAVWEVTGSGSSFILNPNPNKGTFMINGKLATGSGNNLSITVNNVLGQVVDKRDVVVNGGSVSEQFVLPVGLPSGVYMVVVHSGSDRIVFRMTLDK